VNRLLALLGVLMRIATADAATPEAEPSLWGAFAETNFPFFSSALDARKLGAAWPTNNLTVRGLVLRLGNGAWACFDTDLLRVSAIWMGDGVTPVSMAQISYHSPGAKALEGESKLPEISGVPWLANGVYPGWQAGDRFTLEDRRDAGPDPRQIGRGPLAVEAGRFRAIRVERDGVVLEYEIAGVPVRERIASESVGGRTVVWRHFEMPRVSRRLWLLVGRRPAELPEKLSMSIGLPAEAAGVGGIELLYGEEKLRVVRVDPSARPVRFNVQMALGKFPANWNAPFSVRPGSVPARRWPESVVTRGELSTSKDAFVTDNIAPPDRNPWRRNVRIADIAFFRNGTAAVVTFDGDVWMVSGLDGDLDNVRWRRFTSGLHEPMSLCVRDNELFVFDRNGIWRLRDSDGNGEADVHELFSNAFTQTAETREYACGMKLAPDGSFVIAKGGIQMTALGKHNGSVLRVSPDGTTTEVLGWGLRSPFVGVHPVTGLVTASDQQGHYVPTTPLHIIRDRQYYGFLSNLLPKEKYPAPIAEPLTWIPYPVNPSGGSQVWLVNAKMGALNDALIHLGYYRPEIFQVLLNRRGTREQATVISITRDLQFAPLNAAVNPRDGLLYVAGLQIWGTVAKQFTGVARLRPTGTPSTLPTEVAPTEKGVLLRFGIALDPAAATRAENFSAERWNYVRTANYGSPHFKRDGSKGQEAMTPANAYLSRDRKAVFVAIPDMRTVMQMRIGWALKASDGTEFNHNAYFTPHELTPFDPKAEGFDGLQVDLSPRAADLAAPVVVSAEEGRRLSELMGCVACHSTDGSTVGKVGPSWKGLSGGKVLLAGRSEVTADDAYLRESIREPAAKIVSGFEKSDTAMPSYEGVITDAQIESLILYIKTLR
jgi:mono/diheme cytochrome c family protein